MSELFTLKAAVREDQGKGASRRLRRTNRIPGIVYGSKEAPEAIALEHNEVVHQLENEAFYTSIIELDFGDRKEQVVLRDLQRHPFKPAILHLDLQRISATEKLLMRIPLHFFYDFQHGFSVFFRIGVKLRYHLKQGFYILDRADSHPPVS